MPLVIIIVVLLSICFIVVTCLYIKLTALCSRRMQVTYQNSLRSGVAFALGILLMTAPLFLTLQQKAVRIAAAQELDQATELSGYLEKDAAYSSGQSGMVYLVVEHARFHNGIAVDFREAAIRPAIRCRIPMTGKDRDPAQALSSHDVVQLKLDKGWVQDWKLIAPAQGLWALRRQIQARLYSALDHLDPSLRSLSLALLLGRQDILAADVVGLFRDAGSTHLLALSGMHLSLIAALILAVTLRFFGRRFAGVSAIIVSCIFIFIAGPYPAAVRGLCMFVISTLARLAGIPMSPLAAHIASIPVCAWLFPDLILMPGFQLSVWALHGILSFGPWIKRATDRRWYPRISGDLASSTAAQIMCTPYLLILGFPLRPAGVVLGLLLAPLTVLFMAFAALFLFLDLLGVHALIPALLELENSAAWILYRIMLGIAGLASG